MKNKFVRHYLRVYLLDKLGTLTATGNWVDEPSYKTVMSIKFMGRDGKIWFEYVEDFNLDDVVNAGRFFKVKPVNGMDEKVINTDYVLNFARVDLMDCLYRDTNDRGRVEEVLHRFVVPVGHRVRIVDEYMPLNF